MRPMDGVTERQKEENESSALCRSYPPFHQVVVPPQRCLSPWQLSLRRVDVGAMGSEDVLFKTGSRNCGAAAESRPE